MVEEPQTNLVFVPAARLSAEGFFDALAGRGGLSYLRNQRRVRLVTHPGVDDVAVDGAVTAIAATED